MYAKLAIEGNPLTFKQLNKQRTEWSNKYINETKLSSIRRRADLAWHEKNYELVIELYESIIKDLTSTELKKLEYCKNTKRKI